MTSNKDYVQILKGILYLVLFMGGGVLFVWMAINFYNEIPTWENVVIGYMVGFIIATILTANMEKNEKHTKSE